MEKNRIQEGMIKIKVQRRIVWFSVLLLIGKFIAFFLTHSVGILTDALESIVNVTAGFISLYSIIFASRPRDAEHPFGRGKIELISASVEGILIVLAGLAILYEGVRRLFHPALIEQLDIGIFLIALAGLVNFILGAYSIRIGRKYDSIALIASGKHLHSDTYSTIGLVIGLILLYWTHWLWVDSILAVVFGSIIVYTGIAILRRTVANLIDKADTKILRTLLGELLINRREDWIDVHNLKVLKYGSAYYVDCGLTLPWFYNLRQGHAVCDEVRKMVSMRFKNHVRLNIHVDPCKNEYCSNCNLQECMHRSHPFVQLNIFTLDNITKNEE